MYNGSLCAGPHKMTVAPPRQPDPRPDPNPNPNPNPNPLRGSRSALEVDRGRNEFTCKSENVAVRAIKRLVLVLRF